jgi:hypothetical protein
LPDRIPASHYHDCGGELPPLSEPVLVIFHLKLGNHGLFDTDAFSLIDVFEKT